MAMTHDQVVDLLSVATAFDRRTVGKGDVLAWHAAIGDLDFEDARDAVVAHYCERPDDWLKPGHIIERVRAVRLERLEAAGDLQAAMIRDGVDPDDPSWQSELHRRRQRAMSRPTSQPQPLTR